MGWLSNMGSISALLVIALAFLSTVVFASNDCDFLTTDTIKVDPSDEPFVHLNALNLQNPTKPSCTWNISHKIDNTFLALSRVALGPNDTITVTGVTVGKTGTISNTTLFTSSGSQVPGLISTGSCNYLLVTLTVAPNAPFDRTFSSVYYFNSSFVHLQKDAGLFSFLLNTNTDKIKANFVLQPDIEYSDRVILFNITQLPNNFQLTLNGDLISNASPSFYLQKNSTLKVDLEYTRAKDDKGIQASYWLVTPSCSGQFDLKLSESKSILYPNEVVRQQQVLTDIKCAQYFTSPAGTKFQVVIDKNASGLANPGDSLNVYAADGSLELGLNNPALMYFRTIENFLSGNKFLVIYDSPFASVPNSEFKAPSMKVVADSQSQTFMLTEKDLSVLIKLDGNGRVVHYLYPANFGGGKNPLVELSNIGSLKPDQLTIKIFNSETKTELNKAVVTLGKFDRLPSVISSNTQIMQIEYSGIKQDLNVTYRLIDPKTNCQLLYPFATTFEVYGGQSDTPCSWYIPDSESTNALVINPTILKIPKDKVLTVTTFTKSGSKDDNYSGPLNQFYFPDIFLNSSNAYQFKVDSSKVTNVSLHLLIASKANYLTEAVRNITPSDNVLSISSVNYPGFYPVGMTQNWVFINDTATEKFALVTFKDIHLADAHTLTMTAKNNNPSFNGIRNITEIPDYLVTFPFSFTLNAGKDNKLTSSSNRGFELDLEYPGIIADLAPKFADKPTVITFNSSTQSVPSKPFNIYRVSIDDGSKSLSDTILRINISLPEKIDKTKASVTVYDSLSLRKADAHYANLVNGTTDSFLGSIRSVLIVYNYSALVNSKTDFSINITVIPEKCTNSKGTPLKCHTTDRCITDAMLCNGFNDCGDFTDELYCNGTNPVPPPSPPAPSGGGVNTLVVLFLLMPMSAILGIVGYIYLPQFLLRIRRGRYSEFRDLSEVS